MELRLNIKSAWINLLLIGLLPVFSGCGKPEVTELSSRTIEQDTTWSGIIVINGDIYVPPGVTLTIDPGTIVKFRKIDEKSDQNLFHPDSPYYPEAELIIRGRLIARGTPDKRIVFTSAEIRPNPADWGALNFLGSDGNVIEYVKIYCAYNGIHAHGSSVHIANSEFARNGVAVSFKKEEEEPDAPWFGKPSDMRIVNNLFANNKGGIGCRNSTAEIRHNEIRENKFFGIWPKEECEALISYNEIKDNDRGVYLYQVQGMQLEHNNIYNNRSYDIAVAEAQDFPVKAANNWFGTTDPGRIAARLFDRDDDPDVAEIVIQPVLAGPVEWKTKS